MRHDELGVRIAESARFLVGTPFHWHGRVPGVGIDCSGVLVVAFNDAGVPLASPKRYGKRGHLDQFDDCLSKCCSRVEISDPFEPGDVLVFATTEDEAHAGIWTGVSLIHADGSPTTSRVVEGPIPELIRSKLVRVYRVKDES